MAEEDHGQDIEDLVRQIRLLIDALNTATLLLDGLITEMRLKDVTPSAKIIVAKAGFDQTMRRLLGG